MASSIEIEARVAAPAALRERAQAIAEVLLARLGIDPSAVAACAYIDLLDIRPDA